MMATASPPDILNELLALELNCLPQRLIESGAFVSARARSDYDRLRVLSQNARQHAGALAELIQNLGGVPQPALPKTDTAGYHFTELTHARNLLLDEQQRVVRDYAAAGARLSSVPRAASLVATILEDHRRALDEFSAQKNARG